VATYVVHFCKNKQCNRAWIDEDLTRAKRPPSWKYCPVCVAQGMTNPTTPPRNEKIAALSKAKWAKGQIRQNPQTLLE